MGRIFGTKVSLARTTGQRHAIFQQERLRAAGRDEGYDKKREPLHESHSLHWAIGHFPFGSNPFFSSS